MISGKQCKIETAARHKNCSLARLTLSHFHRTTNDQFVTFPLDHFHFSAIFTNVYRFHFPPYRHFGIYVLSGMLFHLKYIPPHSIWIVTWIKIPPSFPFSAILCRVLLQNSLSLEAHQHFQNVIVVVLVSNQAQENGDWLTRSGNMMESFSMELRCWPR